LFMWLLRPLFEMLLADVVGDRRAPVARFALGAAFKLVSFVLLMHAMRPQTLYELGGGPKTRSSRDGGDDDDDGTVLL